MTTRMVHPLHGATHAYDNGEIERLKGFGWAVEGVTVPAAVLEALTDADASKKMLEAAAKAAMPAFKAQVEADVMAVARKKPGPKPKAK